METKPTVSIVVPCYNEEESIPSLIERLRALVEPRPDWEVLFVDDGSKDGTGKLLDEAASRFAWARVSHHIQNLGLGSGIRTGFLNTASAYVCTIDSDGTYPPESLPSFIELLRDGADIVTASPWHPDNDKAEGGFHRIVLSRGVSLCYRLVTGTDYYTFTALFRAYRREVVDRVRFDSNGFPAVTELLIRAIAHGYRIAEVPMPLLPRERGESKMSIGKAVRGHLSLLMSARRWIGSERRKSLQQVPYPPGG
jgi:dolichol-phosphate mannosyltransferase